MKRTKHQYSLEGTSLAHDSLALARVQDAIKKRQASACHDMLTPSVLEKQKRHERGIESSPDPRASWDIMAGIAKFRSPCALIPRTLSDLFLILTKLSACGMSNETFVALEQNRNFRVA